MKKVTMRVSRKNIACLLGVIGCIAASGCRKEDMSDQPKFYQPYRETSQFTNGTTARPIPAGTIARGHLELEKDLYTGKMMGSDGKTLVDINYIPIQITKDDLERGQQKFNIYCAPCHGKLGDGTGMIVTRGMVRPPSFVRVDRPMTDREINIQRAPAAHFFDVITNGWGAMYSYNDKVAVGDRWRIAAYIKTLQVSQDADLKMAVMDPAVTLAPVPVQTTVGNAGTPAPAATTQSTKE
jgi:mono/diheme cytochrome c family protein